MKVVTLYFDPAADPLPRGDGLYARMLETWCAAALNAGPAIEILVVSDQLLPFPPDVPKLCLIGEKWSGLQPEHPFDRKGMLLCQILLALDEPFLYLDLDALLVPGSGARLSALVSRLSGASLAMPIDLGAIRRPLIECQGSELNGITKRCAGVIYFGSTAPPLDRGAPRQTPRLGEESRDEPQALMASRSSLVASYQQAFAELRRQFLDGRLREQRHLLEQWAWSVVCHQMRGATLPDTLNWPAGIWGKNPAALVEHWYGRQKDMREWGTGYDRIPARAPAATHRPTVPILALG